MEAEAHGEGETLARHEKLLLDLAKRRNYNVTQIYREVVSGETIAARPVMQHLLQEVEQGLWDGVLVVEVERLARGDTIDQGIMAQAFKYSNTEIITPLKVYDPNNEFDEEYFEFGLFMSRREYKTINRRLQRGRAASAKEGKYVSGRTPYGYDRIRVPNDKGWTLKPKDVEADIVRFIFSTYAKGEQSPDGDFQPIGIRGICKRLDDMHVAPPSLGDHWEESTVRSILRNPLYVGKIRWNTKKRKKRVVNGSVSYERATPPPDEQIYVDGLHPPLVSQELFDRVQEIFARKGVVPVQHNNDVVNPLAGILVCAKCGRTMVRRPSNPPVLSCPNRICDNISSRYDVVEERLLASLSQWLTEYRLVWSDNPDIDEASSIAVKQKALAKATAEVDTLNKQLARTHDLLEQGVYDTDTFLARSRSINERMQSVQNSIKELSEAISRDEQIALSRVSIIPKVEHLLEVYGELPTAAAKNDMLKDIIERVEYSKETRSGRNGPYDNFDLLVFPKLPSSRE